MPFDYAAFRTLLSVNDISTMQAQLEAMLQLPAFAGSQWDRMYNGLIHPCLVEKQSGFEVNHYRLVPASAHPDGLEYPQIPDIRLVCVRLDLEGSRHVIADACNALLQFIRHKLGAGGVNETYATLILTYGWMEILFGPQGTPVVLSSVAVSGTCAEMPTAGLLESLAGCNLPGPWKTRGWCKRVVQEEHLQALQELMSDVQYEGMREFERLARARGEIGDERPDPKDQAGILNCAERPFIIWLFVMSRRVLVSEARRGLDIKVVTIRKKSVPYILAALRQSMQNSTGPVLVQLANTLLQDGIGKLCLVAPCWRCRLAISYADDAQVVTLHIEYQDRNGWHLLTKLVWTIPFLYDFFSQPEPPRNLITSQGEPVQDDH